MLMYVLIFTIVGFFIGLISEDEGIAIGIIIVISIIWAFMMGPWAIAAFIELMVGYGISKISLTDISLTDVVAIEEEEKESDNAYTRFFTKVWEIIIMIIYLFIMGMIIKTIFSAITS